MNKERKIPVTIYLESSFLDEIDAQLQREKFRSRSHAIRYFIRLGRKIDYFKTNCKDPEFVKKMKESWNEYEIMNWADNVSPEERETISMALEISKDSRYKEWCIQKGI